MKVAIGCDHAGFLLKESLKKTLVAHNIDVMDVGTTSLDAVDYPDFAKKVAFLVAKQKCDRGVMICGSGVGACIASNKIIGARASVCHDTYSAHQGVEHDDMNILVLGSRIIGQCLAQEILNAFIGAKFSNEERHLRRLNKVLAIEKSQSRS